MLLLYEYSVDAQASRDLHLADVCSLIPRSTFVVIVKNWHRGMLWVLFILGILFEKSDGGFL
jgi:hypothetical protein